MNDLGAKCFAGPIVRRISIGACYLLSSVCHFSSLKCNEVISAYACDECSWYYIIGLVLVRGP